MTDRLCQCRPREWCPVCNQDKVISQFTLLLTYSRPEARHEALRRLREWVQFLDRADYEDAVATAPDPGSDPVDST